MGYNKNFIMSTVPDWEVDGVMDLKMLKFPPVVIGKEENEYYRRTSPTFLPKLDDIYQQRTKVKRGEPKPSGADSEWSDDLVDEEAVEKKVFHPDFPADAKGLPTLLPYTR